MSCSLLGDGVRGVCPCGNGKRKDFAATPVVACVQMGEASKTRNATTKARRSSINYKVKGLGFCDKSPDRGSLIARFRYVGQEIPAFAKGLRELMLVLHAG